MLRIGELVGERFRLAEQVGAGGMGIVFRALDEQTKATVALKLLEGRSAEEITRARLEAESLARCSHPAIVRHVADGELPAGGMYLAMDWIDGVTLSTRLAAEGVSLREAIAIVGRVADALATAHRARVLHRDVKPSNVLLAGNDPARATLIDFGVARVSDMVHGLTRTGAAIGTPGYMSPEQARGERLLTPAADVFGLGCVLYECATGQPAFSGSVAAAVLIKIMFAHPPPITTACPEAPRELGALIEAMLAKNADARLADCEAVVAALDRLPALPDGPRRGTHGLIDEPTVRAVPEGEALHCIVGAARGRGEDVLEPPDGDQLARLRAAAIACGAALQVLATGAVAADLVGKEGEASRSAARLALALREILPGWTIAISSVTSASRAVDTATMLLDKTVTAAIFKRLPAGTIAIDKRTAGLLDGEFLIERSNDRDSVLIGQRGAS